MSDGDRRPLGERPPLTPIVDARRGSPTRGREGEPAGEGADDTSPQSTATRRASSGGAMGELPSK